MANIKMTGANQGDIVTLLNALLTQVNAANVDIALLNAAIAGVNAQLDADAGVTDTDYAANWDPAAVTGAAITDTVEE